MTIKSINSSQRKEVIAAPKSTRSPLEIEMAKAFQERVAALIRTDKQIQLEKSEYEIIEPEDFDWFNVDKATLTAISLDQTPLPLIEDDDLPNDWIEVEV